MDLVLYEKNQLYQEYLKAKFSLVSNYGEIQEVVNKQVNNMLSDDVPQRSRIENYLRYLCKKRHLSFRQFCDEEYGIVYDLHTGRMNVMDGHGKYISDRWFNELEYFDGNFIVKNSWYNIMNKNGELILSKWYKRISPAYNGIAVVTKEEKYESDGKKDTRNKYNLIDKEGNVLLKDWYDYIADFNNKYTVAKKVINDKECYNIMDSTGKLLFKDYLPYCWNWKYREPLEKSVLLYTKESLDNTCYLVSLETGEVRKYKGKIHDLNNGVVLIKSEDNKQYLFNSSSLELLNKEYFDDVEVARNEHSPHYYPYYIVRKNGKYNIINNKGKLILKEWLDEGIEIIGHDMAYWHYADNPTKAFYSKFYYKFRTRKTNRQIFVDENNDIVFEIEDPRRIKLNKFDKHYVNLSFAFDNKETQYCHINKELNGYEDKKTIFGYKCFNEEDEFYLKVQPLKIYGFSYVICMDVLNERYYLYDREKNTYTNLGIFGDVEFNDNFIKVNNENLKKIYFFYNNSLYDVTKLMTDIDTIKIKDDINPEILTEEEFLNLSLDQQRKLIQDIGTEKIKLEEENNIRKELELKKQKEEEEAKEKESKKKAAMQKLQESLALLNSLNLSSKETPRFNVENLLIDFGDYKEINPDYFQMLKYVDFSNVSLRNVKVNGIDFRGCNIDLIPRQVYNQDLSGCNFEGMHIPEFMDFTGCDIRGAHFSEDDDPKTPDGKNMTFKYAIYDEATTYNGIPFTQIYGPCMATQQAENKLNKM